MTATELQQAQDELSARLQVYEAAKTAVNAAEARVCLLALVAIADEQPAITGFHYDTSAEYDDEGGYYDTATVWPDVDDDHPSLESGDLIPPEDYDDYTQFSSDALRLIFGDEDNVVTVAQLREKLTERP